jgi:DNA-binding beta-propeller fold protein YncE
MADYFRSQHKFARVCPNFANQPQRTGFKEATMNSTRILPIALAGLTLLIAGCADNHLVMNLADTGQETPPKVWPSPPEEARYSYVGELTGEDNFRPDNWANQSNTTKLFNWLVGLTGLNSQPVVLQRPQSGMVDSEGRIYVTDIGRGAVFVFDKPAGKLEVWDSVRGSARFVSPIGIIQGPRNEVWVTDSELKGVFRLDKNGGILGEFGHDILERPTGIARDPQRGRVYVADTQAHDIKVFDDNGKLLNVIGQRGEDDGEFNFPTYLTFADDKLYVTDTMNSRIQILDADGNFIAKFGKLGLNVGNLVRPKGVAVDSVGNIYVIESLYDNMLVFDKKGRTLLAIGGSGQGVGEFYLPSGIWIDNHDQVYIADMYNGRVMVLQFLGSQQ